MKILLIQAATENPEGPIFPLGLASLAAVLCENHDLRVVDMNVEQDALATIRNVGGQFQPDIVGLSVRNIKVALPGEHVSCVAELRETVRQIKRLVPGATIILGGAGFSLYAEFFMKSIEEIDYGVLGEGESVVPQFLKQFPDPVGIKGILFRQSDHTIVSQGKAERPLFKDLPRPRRDLFPMDAYRRYPTSVGVMTKRGCPYRCIHCSDIYLLGKRIRLRPPEDIVEELRSLKEDYNVTHFMFADQTFNFPVDYTKTLLRAMIDADLGMQWTAYFTPQGLDREMLQLFKQSGCSIISFSPDSCTNLMLASLGRGFCMEDLDNANRLIKESGMQVTYNFMQGLPGENLHSILRTIYFVFKTKLMLRRQFALHGLFFVPVRIYPHTVLREIAVRQCVIDSSDVLAEPRFFRPKAKMLQTLNGIILAAISTAWKIKHRLKKN